MMRQIIGLAGLVVFTYGAPRARQAPAFPSLPFSTSGSNILTSNGEPIKLAGTNWPGHGAVMIPEGLQHQPIETIVSDIKSLGMNVVRLTYAIEMIDQIYDNGGEDLDLQFAFVDALGEENGTSVLAAFLDNNPQFTETSKRLEVFDAVAAELSNQEIYINLDNHISRGEWCCSGTDGNTWWGDTYFNLDNWMRGLSYMAEHGSSWSNLASMSLRNELREPTNNGEVQETYNWETWYTNVLQGANAVNAANPDTLVILSGLNYDTTMQPVVRGQALEPGTRSFSFDDFDGYADKLVIELHNYNTETDSCDDLSGSIYNGGAQAMNPEEESTVNVFPVLVTEFGFAQDGQTYRSVYATCLAEWLPDNTAGWMNWVVAGSYYERQGQQEFDEAWGLYNADWTGWRDEAYVAEQLTLMVQATLG